jgi:hypothetical protein
MSWREAYLKHLGPGLFAGITLGRWLRILRENHFVVDRPYWGRAAAITAGSITNTLGAAWENSVYGRRIGNRYVAPPAAHPRHLAQRDDSSAQPACSG